MTVVRITWIREVRAVATFRELHGYLERAAENLDEAHGFFASGNTEIATMLGVMFERPETEIAHAFVEAQISVDAAIASLNRARLKLAPLLPDKLEGVTDPQARKATQMKAARRAEIDRMAERQGFITPQVGAEIILDFDERGKFPAPMTDIERDVLRRILADPGAKGEAYQRDYAFIRRIFDRLYEVSS
jgi:hypothetical protein